MKVLAVTPRYPPKSRVGAWLATHGIMRHLAANGHEVTAASANDYGNGWEIDGVKVETGRRGRSHFVTTAADHEVVVSHFGDGGLGATIARKAGRPSVQMVHGYVHKGPASADLLVFNSHSNRDSCVDLRDIPTIVCYPPVDTSAYATAPGDCVTIVNCSAEKGIRTAWKCAEALPRLQFLGVRGGYGQQTVPRASNFETAPTTRNMRDDVYARTRILLMPSENETFGMAAVEAMASGIPVIAHPTPGLLEALGDAGVFVDRSDIRGWVEQIVRLHDVGEYVTASAKAFGRVAELEAEMRAGLDLFTQHLEGLCALSSASRFELATALTALRRGSVSQPI
jgi:glycosyltransferase involved in cell wall biosynthesis